MSVNHKYLVILFLVWAPLVKAEVKTTFFAEGLSFLSPDYDDIDQKNFYFLGVRFKSNTRTDDAFKIDLTQTYAVNKTVLSYTNPRELSYALSVGDNSQLMIGRHLHIWSALDTFWTYSYIQPVFKWNSLDQKNQGLTGLFYQYKSGATSLMFYGSPLYIPDQGASYEIKDGQFESGNPFFQAPPQNLKFQGQVLPIDYNIERPKTEDIIFRTSFGAQIRYGENKGYFAQAMFMSKPSNQLALAYKGILVTTRVRVDVTPKTYTENIYAADFGYRDDWGFLLFSALYDQPKDPEFDPIYNAPHFEASTVFGPQFLYKMAPFEFLLAYMDTSGGKISESGPDVSSDRKSLSQRFLFKQAALAGVTFSQTFDKRFHLHSSFQYKFSPREAYRQIRFRNDLNLSGPWAFWVDLLLIDTNSNIESGYEAYKNRDQLWLGASYDL